MKSPSLHTSKPRRPVLRYHGGKWMLAPWIISHFPGHERYVEPYCGAASVLLRKPRARHEVIGDLDGNVVNLFRLLQAAETRQALAERLYFTPYAREVFEMSYEPVDGEDLESRLEQARRFVARSYMTLSTTFQIGHRTGFRANSSGRSQTGAIDWKNYPSSLQAVGERLRGVVVESRPALEMIRQQDGAGTLFYLDPPYLHETRSALRYKSDMGRCYSVEMTLRDHVRMAYVLRDVEGMVVLSGYQSDLYRILFEEHGWQRVDKDTYSDGGRPRRECLWLNLAAQDRRSQMRLFE